MSASTDMAARPGTTTPDPQGRAVARLFFAIVMLQLVLAVLSIEVLSGVRAYVAGESLYAKGHKDALLHLQRYLQAPDDGEYDAFLRALRVPEGDAQARRALQQSPPDWDQARAGFLAGGNHPRDIDALIRLFVVGEDLPFFARAIEIWTEADAAVASLRGLGERARMQSVAGRLDAATLRELDGELPALNQRLSRLERAFSSQLVEAASIAERSLLALNLLLALGLSLLGGLSLRQSLRAQRQREAEMVALVGAVGDAMLTVDEQQRIVLFNPAAAALFGCTAEAARGTPIERFIPSGLAPAAPGSVQELEGLRVDGRLLQLELTLSPLNTERGAHTSLVCRDVTARRQAQERERRELVRHNEALALKASTDALTGLPNRDALEHHLSSSLASARRDHARLSLLFLDLDGFKAINDQHGHLSGDELLRQVAARLRDALRRGDAVFRVSGDEFVIVVGEDKGLASAETVVGRVLEAMRAPYALATARVSVTASIGVASYPEDGDDARALMLAADAAMYRAKQGGKDGFQRGAPLAPPMELPPLLRELERALRDEELRLHYQPIVDTRDASVLGAEALIRWQHPTRGLLLPAEFVPLAEAHGLCDRLGDWVLAQVLHDLAAAGTNPAGTPDWVTLNLSASQLRNPALARQVEQALQQAGLAPSRLGLELTESMALHDAQAGYAVLHALRELGCFVCLDDFGTGHSSLSQLHRMPLDRLKIDRSFIEPLADDDAAQRIVEALTAMAGALRIELVAEGVETAAQQARLRQLGVHQLQGFGIARPMPWPQLLRFAADWRLPAPAADRDSATS